MPPKRWGERWINSGSSPKEGGQGCVFIVTDSSGSLSGQFALKELKNPKRQSRFQREIETLRALPGHPNVMPLVDASAFDTPDKPYYVMPLGEHSLADAVGGNVTEEVLRRLSLFTDLCVAVEHLHSHGVLHRDIKPENVQMVGGILKLADFGLCLVVDLPRLTETAEAVGSRYYMAPELQAGRNLDVDVRADIYSLGKVLYFLLSGGRMFPREEFAAVRFWLSRLTGDDRLDLFHRVFERSIRPSQWERFDSVSALLACFREQCDRYRAHARTRVELRIGNGRLSVGIAKDLIPTLEDDELNEVLAGVGDDFDAPESFLLDAVTRVGPASARRFVALLGRIHVALSVGTIDEIGVSLFSRPEIASALLGVRAGFVEEFTYRLALRAIMARGDVVKHVARHAFMRCGRQPHLLVEIVRRFDELDADGRVQALLECAHTDAPALGPFLLDLANRADLSEKEFTALLAAVARLGTSEAAERLKTLAETLTDGEQKRITALIGGIGLNPSAVVLDVLSEAKWASRLGKRGYELIREGTEERRQEDSSSADDDDRH